MSIGIKKFGIGLDKGGTLYHPNEFQLNILALKFKLLKSLLTKECLVLLLHAEKHYNSARDFVGQHIVLCLKLLFFGSNLKAV